MAEHGASDGDPNSPNEQQYQPEPTGMYELEFPAPQLSSADGRGPVLIHALEGFSDAGHAIRLAAKHLKDALDTELVASFAIDELAGLPLPAPADDVQDRPLHRTTTIPS